MDAITYWLGQDYHWLAALGLQIVMMLLFLWIDVYDGPVINNVWQRNLHFLAIFFWEITLVCMVMYLIFYILMTFGETFGNFWMRVRRAYSLR